MGVSGEITCESCKYLSDGFRCQRVTSSSYSRKMSEPENWLCSEWEQHPIWDAYLREVSRKSGTKSAS